MNKPGRIGMAGLAGLLVVAAIILMLQRNGQQIGAQRLLRPVTPEPVQQQTPDGEIRENSRAKNRQNMNDHWRS
jgi:hypothetical protein